MDITATRTRGFSPSFLDTNLKISNPEKRASDNAVTACTHFAPMRPKVQIFYTYQHPFTTQRHTNPLNHLSPSTVQSALRLLDSVKMRSRGRCVW